MNNRCTQLKTIIFMNAFIVQNERTTITTKISTKEYFTTSKNLVIYCIHILRINRTIKYIYKIGFTAICVTEKKNIINFSFSYKVNRYNSRVLKSAFNEDKKTWISSFTI